MRELVRFAPKIESATAHAIADLRRSHGFVHLGKAFDQAPAVSIDVAVMERTEHAAVVPLDAGWSDMGSWSSLWEVSERDEAGNAFRGDAVLVDSQRSYVHASNRLVVTLGLVDHVVVETSDAVLVAPRARAQEVKEVVARLQANARPEADVHTKVERPWGTYEVTDQGAGFQVKRLTIAPGGQLSLQFHSHRSEWWIVVAGQAVVQIGDEQRTLNQGTPSTSAWACPTASKTSARKTSSSSKSSSVRSENRTSSAWKTATAERPMATTSTSDLQRDLALHGP